MTETKQLKTASENTDQFYYPSAPYINTNIDTAAAIGRLFGMETKAPNESRVLELGCGDGMNILSFADRYTDAEFIGIDHNDTSISAGKELVRKAGLKNIELKKASILDIDNSYGKFDYIVCHGIFSWVPEDVRNKILDVFSTNLNPNGIGIVSYNTLPGWNYMRNTVRELLMYHTAAFETIEEKFEQARMLLKFFKDSLTGHEDMYSKGIINELEHLNKQPIHYFIHEYLVENNKPMYFSEFMDMAYGHKLQYLANPSLANMYTGNFKKEVADILSTADNAVKQEQYMDFLRNTSFKTSLLCHQGIEIKRNISADNLTNLCFSSNIAPKNIDVSKLDFSDQKSHETPLEFTFQGVSESSLQSDNNLLTALFLTFNEYINCPLSWSNLAKKIEKKFFPGKPELVDQILRLYLPLMLVKGIVDISVTERDRDALKVNLDKPKISSLLRLQSENLGTDWVSNINHGVIKATAIEKAIMVYMDGEKTKKDIIALLLKDWENEKINLMVDDKPTKDKALVEKTIAETLDRIVTSLHKFCILQ